MFRQFTSESEWRDFVKAIAHAVCSARAPGEHFEPIWRAVAQLLARSGGSSGTPSTEFAWGIRFHDDAELATPLIILTVYGTMKALESRGVTPKLEGLPDIAQSVARRLGADESLARELGIAIASELTTQLARLRGITPPAGATPQEGIKGMSIELASVVWCEVCATGVSASFVSCSDFPETAIEKRFVERGATFALFIDERWLRITVCPLLARASDTSTKGAVDVAWDDLDARHLRLLGLFLDACIDGAPIHFTEIATKALGYGRHAVPLVNRAIYRAYSELNARLRGVLRTVMRAKPNTSSYVLKGCFPFCWIRRNTSRSLLRIDHPPKN